MKNLHTLNFLPILALATLFIFIRASACLHSVLTGPNVAYLGSRVAFRCITTDSSSTVTYELIRDGDVLMGTYTNIEGEQPAPFFLKVFETSEGSYHCKATAGGSTGVSNIIKLSVVTPASNTRVTSDPFPPVAYEGSRFILSCDVARGSHLSYIWFFNRKEVTSSAPSSLRLTGNQLVMGKVTPEHAGYYSCMAWSRVQDTRRFSSSTEVQVTVKVNVSKPSISFSISKDGGSYHGNITCCSARGSPPVNFSLSLDHNVVGSVTSTESLTASFPIEIVPGVDMGVARCRVNTEVQELMSEPVTLLVVPVGGDVKVEVEYLYRADSTLSAARLCCQVNKGTFPYVSWLFNDFVLPSEKHEDSRTQPVLSHYAIADHRHTLFLAKLGPKESGYYRCRARDSYDDSGPWVESEAVLVQGTGDLSAPHHMTIPPPRKKHTSLVLLSTEVPITTIEIITIVFCCSLLLALAVGVSCVYKMFNNEQAYTHIVTSSSDALPLSAPTSWSGGSSSSTDCDAQNQTLEITV